MTAYVVVTIALIALVGIVLIAAAFFDRRRGRQIERDLGEPPSRPVARTSAATRGGRHHRADGSGH